MEYELGKRTYIDFQETLECSVCGADITVDMNEQYMSYPVPGGKANRYSVDCDECGARYVVPYAVSLTAERVGEPALTFSPRQADEQDADEQDADEQEAEQ